MKLMLKSYKLCIFDTYDTNKSKVIDNKAKATMMT